jgi:hypothetical protein
MAQETSANWTRKNWRALVIYAAVLALIWLLLVFMPACTVDKGGLPPYPAAARVAGPLADASPPVPDLRQNNAPEAFAAMMAETLAFPADGYPPEASAEALAQAPEVLAPLDSSPPEAVSALPDAGAEAGPLDTGREAGREALGPEATPCVEAGPEAVALRPEVSAPDTQPRCAALDPAFCGIVVNPEYGCAHSSYVTFEDGGRALVRDFCPALCHRCAP